MAFDGGAPGERTFYRVKVPNPPCQWEGLAKGKGAYREVGSEESRMLGVERSPNGQNSDLTNRNHIEAVHGGKTAIQVEAQ